MTLAALKAEARDRNLPWGSVQAVYRDIKATERESRERPNAIRLTAWCLATSPGCHSFWGIGFQKRWGKKAAEADLTVVPGYDAIAQVIGSDFPEYGGDDGTERLFDFLFSDYSRMPSAASMYERAMDRVEFELTTSEPVDYHCDLDF